MSALTAMEAAVHLARKLARLNRTERACNLPALHQQDRTDMERVMELQARVNLLLADGPSHDVLDSLGAQVIAFKMALAERDVLSVTSGDEAA